MGGGAWPFLVGGLICLVYSDNERDLCLLSRHASVAGGGLLRGTIGSKPEEARGNNRSVMPLDVLGRTRATLTGAESRPWPEGLGNLANPVVLGIVHCNYWS